MTNYVDVAVPVGVRKSFAYSVPRALRDHVSVGVRVLVPFGRKTLPGFVVGCRVRPPEGDFRIRPVRDVVDAEPLLPAPLVEAALWVADYYFTPPGEVLRALLPAGSLGSGERKVVLSERTRTLLAGGLRPSGLSVREELLLHTLAQAGDMNLSALGRQAGLRDVSRWIDEFAGTGWVKIEDFLDRARVAEKTRLGISALPAPGEALAGLTHAQRELYLQLQAAAQVLPLQAALRLAGAGPGVARALEKKRLAAIAPMTLDRIPLELSGKAARIHYELTPAQREAFERVRALLQTPGSARCLLHGVTGSGKTEVYLRLIAEVLAAGDGAILLVPEIGLTPLLSRIAASHFPDRVALLHSGMSPGERFDQWRRIRTGAVAVVVGTRSAVFAPLDRLRLVVIDEEQDSSYKQDESPCYHAREVAWQRLQAGGGVLLMGSATPSVETYHTAAESCSIMLLNLPERIQARPLPEVTVVDMSLEFQRHGRKTVLSGALQSQLEENLRRGEQSIILLNRRGYARSLLCRSCGSVYSCADCSISMTYHQQAGRMICHYCGLEKEPPAACPTCGGEYIYFIGVGTEQLEEILRGRFPRARMARVDRDTTRRRGALRTLLFDFADHKLDMLVGTQILAKGHDFPDVTLVGVVSADSGLAFPDFRAAERTFQLLTQVAGRAGRGRTPGRVIIQSFYPDHYALQFARRQDYLGFHRHEIEFRRMLGYPPFRSLVQILVTAANADKGLKVAGQVTAEIQASAVRLGVRAQIQVLGPAPAPLEKLRGKFRFQVLLKGKAGESLSGVLEDAFTCLGQHKVPLKDVRVDVDPLSLL